MIGRTFMRDNELAWLTEQAKGKELVVEFGSCYGHSTRALADSAMRVIAVDDFRGPRDQDIEPLERQNIFTDFLENLKDYQNITVMKCDHAEYVVPDCDMAFIDGDHGYDNIKRDLLKFINRKNLFLCGHDYEWWPSVKQAVDELIPDVEVYDGNVWYKQL